MGLWNFQTSFTRGELDPRLAGRIDIQSYYSGVKKAENVLCIPQGGIRRRPGTKFLGESLGESTRLEKFSFKVGIEYLLVFTPYKMQIYKNDVLQTNINGSGLDYVDTPWDGSSLQFFDFIQSADVGIVVHPNIEPQKIVRSDDDQWQVSPIIFSNKPQYDFDDSLSPTPLAELQEIEFLNVNEGDRYKLGLESVLTEDLLFSSDDTTNENAIRDGLQNLINTGKSGISVSTVTPGVKYEIRLAGNSSKDWDLITGTPVLTKDVTFEVKTTRTATGSSRAEDVWSNSRGWPRSVTFHEGRLWFGGSLSRPTTLWASNVNDFFNFKEGKGRDDEAIAATLNTDQLNEIQSVFSNRTLQIFTSGQEFYIKQSPITPSNVAVLPQTNFGSRRVRPVTIEGVTLYAQRTGNSINQFVFVDAVQANQSVSATSLAPHLITDPRKMVVKQGDQDDSANYVYINNFNEGTLTVLNTLLSEDVQAFTQWNSGDSISSIAVVNDKLHLLVNRFINGEYVQHIEREEQGLNTDAAITGISTSGVVNGLDHLEGETVQAKLDGSYLGEFVVSGGQIVLPRSGLNYEVGLKYTPYVETMPLNIGLQDGPNQASKKRIKRIAVNYFESNGIMVNNETISDKTIGINQFSAPEPQTGMKRISLQGWSIEATVKITQQTPYNMTVLSLGLEVAI